jgi:hypothetical protein
LVEKSGANQDPQRKLCSIPRKTLSLSLVNFYYNPKSKPKTSPISLSLSLSTTCTEVWKHKLTGEEVKKVTNYICGKLRMIEIGRIERDIWIWFLEKE